MSLRQGHQGIVPKLPWGHLFSNFPFDAPYWTVTTVIGVPLDAWQVDFGSVAPSNALVEAVKDTPESGYMWCVRGGQTVNHDQGFGYLNYSMLCHYERGPSRPSASIRLEAIDKAAPLVKGYGNRRVLKDQEGRAVDG